LLLIGLAVAWWYKHFQQYTPAEVVLDIRAGIAARHDPKPVEKFLELRYGPLTEPTNRQNAFLDFFNVGHIEGLHFLVSHSPVERREKSIHEMAEWVAEYRRTMSPAEKQALRERIQTPAGREMLSRATAKYLSQDVRYRGATSPVIEQLMATLVSVQQQ
jgi:hypothetical protein